MTAYRDDLEAAQLRAADLERELAEARTRNQTLEAEAASRALATYRKDHMVLEATRRGRLTASLVIGALGVMTAGSAFAEGPVAVGVIFTIIFGGFLAFLWGVRRVDPVRPPPNGINRADRGASRDGVSGG